MLLSMCFFPHSNAIISFKYENVFAFHFTPVFPKISQLIPHYPTCFSGCNTEEAGCVGEQGVKRFSCEAVSILGCLFSFSTHYRVHFLYRQMGRTVCVESAAFDGAIFLLYNAK
jgi:hypothetical protein